MEQVKDHYYIYITTNPRKTTLYTGVTNNLKRRMQEHYQNRGNKKSFAGRYYCYNLVYFEHYPDVKYAIEREKEIKNMSAEGKRALISSVNPLWRFIKV